MKILILSDLHLEYGHSYAVPPGTSFDVVVLAGDIHAPGSEAIRWAQGETFDAKPVMFVPGNHEFYGREMATELLATTAASEGTNVHVLSRRSVVVSGVRFLGCTLWTDFQLPVVSPDGTQKTDVARAMATAQADMNDFARIEVSAPASQLHAQYRQKKVRTLLQAKDTLAMHWLDRDWLRSQLASPFDGPTVVVTHHAPALGSVVPRYAQDWLSAAFVSELPTTFFQAPKLWIHGHTHWPTDYQVGSCRVLSNPRGEKVGAGAFLNLAFNPGLIIEIQ